MVHDNSYGLFIITRGRWDICLCKGQMPDLWCLAGYLSTVSWSSTTYMTVWLMLQRVIHPAKKFCDPPMLGWWDIKPWANVIKHTEPRLPCSHSTVLYNATVQIFLNICKCVYSLRLHIFKQTFTKHKHQSYFRYRRKLKKKYRCM